MFSKPSTHPEHPYLRIVRKLKWPGCIQIPKLKILFPLWGAFNIFLPFTRALKSWFLSESAPPTTPTHQTGQILQRKWGLDSQRALALLNQNQQLRMTSITYWCCQMVSACTAQTPRRAKDSSRLLPLPRCLAGWCWLWVPPPRHSPWEEVGQNHSLESETYFWWRQTVKLDFLLENYGRLKPGLEEGANIPNSSLGGAMYTVSWEIAGGRGGGVVRISKGQSPAAYSRQHLSPDACYRLCINRPCCGPCFNWLESVWSCVSPLYDAPVFVPGASQDFRIRSKWHVPGSKFTRTSSIEGEGRGWWRGTGRDPKWAAGWTLGIACQQAAGTGLVPRQRGRDPHLGRLTCERQVCGSPPRSRSSCLRVRCTPWACPRPSWTPARRGTTASPERPRSSRGARAAVPGWPGDRGRAGQTSPSGRVVLTGQCEPRTPAGKRRAWRRAVREPRSLVDARDASAVTAPDAPPRVPCGLLAAGSRGWGLAEGMRALLWWLEGAPVRSGRLLVAGPRTAGRSR